MIHTPVIVVKVGGSLLNSSEVPQRLRSWLAAENIASPNAHFVLVAGGGIWVDAIRTMDAQTPLGEEQAHWICIAVLDVTADLLAAMLPECCAVSTWDELDRRRAEPGITILRPKQFLEECEPSLPGTRLPANWSVTSDAIAGRLAVVLDADELVLLKSMAPPKADTVDRLSVWAAAGYVDTFLPVLVQELPPARCMALPASLPSEYITYGN
jgi:5-(aminomethyl)-3-furanmethanol phosphate kinase